MKDSQSRQRRIAVAAAAAMAILIQASAVMAQQTSHPDRDTPAIYYFPESQPASTPNASPQANGTARYALSPGSSYNQTGAAPASSGAGYSYGSSDQPPQSDEQQQVTFDTNVFCAAPDGSGKPRSEAWVRNCVAAAKVGSNAPSRKAREEILQQQQRALTAGADQLQ